MDIEIPARFTYFRVVTRQPLIGQHEMIALGAADRDHRLVEGHTKRLAVQGTNEQLRVKSGCQEVYSLVVTLAGRQKPI